MKPSTIYLVECLDFERDRKEMLLRKRQTVSALSELTWWEFLLLAGIASVVVAFLAAAGYVVWSVM